MQQMYKQTTLFRTKTNGRIRGKDGQFFLEGAQWLSCIVLDSRPRDCWFEPHSHHYIVSLSKTHLSLLSTGSIQEHSSQHNRKIVGLDVKNQIKQTSPIWLYNFVYVSLPTSVFC